MSRRTKTKSLSNGLRVHYRMRNEVELLERELFADNNYFPSGIGIQDGAIVFDVGANAGMFVLLLSTLVKNAKVFAFEPILDTFELLLLNSSEAKGIEVLPFNHGLSFESKAVEFTHFPRNSVMSSMHPLESAVHRLDTRKIVANIMRERGGLLRLVADYAPSSLLTAITEIVRRYYHKSIKITCQLRTLSQVIDETHPPRIDLLKIDVEGSEFDVLNGLRDKHWPLVRQVVLEVHDGPASAERALAILRRHGFEAWSAPATIQHSLLANVYARRPI